MTRVLVTGGAGFIGSHLVDALLRRRDDVLVVDDLSSGRQDRLPHGVELVRADIGCQEALAAAFDRGRPGTVFHLAAQTDVGASVADPLGDVRTNVLGTVGVLSEAQRWGSRVVLASTGGALYGAVLEIPTPETAPARPESPYGTGKLCAEEYLRLFRRLYGGGHAIVRFGNVYGPRQDPHGEAGVVSIFCAAAARDGVAQVYGDGTQTRDYVYVADAVAALLAADRAPGGGPWNAATGTETSVLTLLELVRSASGRPLPASWQPRRPGELERSALDCRQAAVELGWRPTTLLAEGVSRTLAWIEEGEPPRGAP